MGGLSNTAKALGAIGAILLLGSAASAGNRPDPLAADPQRSFISPLRVALNADGKSGRLDYAACVAPPGVMVPVRMPVARAATPGTHGLDAARSIFRDDPTVTVNERPGGVIHTTVGPVPDAILNTRIARIRFDSTARYNALFALEAISQNPEMKAAMRDAGISEQVKVVDWLFSLPDKRRPHLPRVLKDMTAAEVIDRIATTFGGIATFTMCPQERTIDFDFVEARDRSLW